MKTTSPYVVSFTTLPKITYFIHLIATNTTHLHPYCSDCTVYLQCL